MQTIKLKINDSIYDKIMWFLSKFNKDEIEIISENHEFVSNQNYLQNELNQIETRKAKFYSINEVEDELDEIIAKHENSI
ncbi:MAG: hypothetical protein K8R79_03370 [Calditrichales bacterium]|nr:hypothetical protein [Calditrichales bacterium]